MQEKGTFPLSNLYVNDTVLNTSGERVGPFANNNNIVNHLYSDRQ